MPNGSDLNIMVSLLWHQIKSDQKLDKMDFINIKNLHTANRKVKRQHREWKNICKSKYQIGVYYRGIERIITTKPQKRQITQF